MPKTKKIEALTAAVMFEQLPPGLLQQLVAVATRDGHAVMFGQTRSGKAAIVTIYADDGKSRHFAESTEDLVNTIKDLISDYESL